LHTDVRTPLEIFSMPQHLRVPVFQRRYVWDAQDQWEPLWRDIARVAEQRLAGLASQHFLGAVVTQSAVAGMGTVASHAIIDGQQRLTTLQLVIDAAAAALQLAGFDRHASRLTDLTHNSTAYAPDEAARLKLQHENEDHGPFVAVMSAEPPIDYTELPPGKVKRAHEYFFEQVTDWMGDPPDVARAEALVSALTQGLQIVVISLTDREPSQEIFETLNTRGTPLTAADLIKNFVFQQIDAESGDTRRAFHDQWSGLEKPFWREEVSVGRYRIERLSLFLNHWLVARTGEEVSTRSTFTRFKAWFEECGQRMSDVLVYLRRQADLFESWTLAARKPAADLDPAALFFYRADAVDIEAVKPLLLWLYDIERGLPQEIAERALADVESWVMRRSLLGLPASEYSRVVAALVTELPGTPGLDPAAALHAALLRQNRPGTYWPGDRELTEALLVSPIYNQPRARVRAYLEAVEDHHRGFTTRRPRAESRVRRGELTVEHLLPRHWKESWPVADLAAELDRDAHVHRLGNLTLLTQSLNSSVSNGPWLGAKGKRNALQASDTLLLTRDPRAVTHWGEPDIDARSEAMIRALLDTWRAPADHDPEPVKRTEDSSLSVSLRDLVASGRLAPGTMLVPRGTDSAGRVATITDAGFIRLDGIDHASPSGAGKAVLGRSVNGWRLWRLPDGRELGDLRGEESKAQSHVERLNALLEIDHGRLVQRIGRVLRFVLPDQLDNAGVEWVLTALPNTGRTRGQRRLAALSVGRLEVLFVIETAVDDGARRTWTFNLDAAEARRLFESHHPPGPSFRLDHAAYAGFPEVVQLVADDDEVDDVLNDHDVIRAARALASRLRPNGSSPFRRFHNAPFAVRALEEAAPFDRPAQ